MLRGLRTRLRAFGQDRRGNVLLLAAAGMSGLVGAAGIGVDTVQWYLWKRQLQQAVDSGAMAGALSAVQGYGYSDPAKNALQRTSNQTYILDAVRNPPASGAFAGDNSAIEVIATTQRALPFSSVFLANPPRITARAVATTVSAGAPCVLAVATDGIGVDVFGSAIANVDCPVASNSTGGVSVDLGGSSFLDSDLILSAGGIDYGQTNLPADATIVPYGIPVTDPLASLGLAAPTAPTGCHANNHRVGSNTTQTLPGNKRWCNGLRIQGNAILEGGVYIIDGGTLQINASASVTLAPGTGGVTFILTGSGNNMADIAINGGATMDLRAPTNAEDPVWGGILFYQDDAGNATHTINGGANIDLDGVIYMPTGDLTYNGSAQQSAQCLLIVTERVSFGGSNTIANNCNPDVTQHYADARVVRVVE